MTQRKDAPAPDGSRRLDSWKEIAAHLGVSVRTAQRWEADEELPVKRHRHAKLSSTYADASELDAWRNNRSDTSPKQLRAAPAKPVVAAAHHHSPSIAVLPFSSFDKDQETQIICDGLTDDLITTLSQVAPLRVVARTSSFYFQDKAVDIRDVGGKLGVETVLEGSVQRQGKRLRVTAQLIDATNGCHLWAQRFDREIDDVFSLQDELSLAITRSLRIQLVDRQAFAPRRTEDAQTHNLFVRGRYFWNERSRAGLEKALECYQEAVERDPDFAPAHAGIADCHAFLWVYGGCPWEESVAASEAAAKEALKIDPTLSDAHRSLGLAGVMRYDLRGASEAFQQALDRNPRDHRAQHWHAMVGANLSPIDESLAEISLALELDRFGMTVNQDFGRILYLAGRYDEAIQQLRHTLELAPHAYWARVYLVLAYVQLEKFEEALSLLDEDSLLRAFVRGRMGHTDEAYQALQQQSQRGQDSTWRALLHFCLGENEKALERLEDAWRNHELAFLEMCPKVQPLFTPLQAYPGFDALPPKLPAQS